jgi:hypothetical protein
MNKTATSTETSTAPALSAQQKQQTAAYYLGKPLTAKQIAGIVGLNPHQTANYIKTRELKAEQVKRQTAIAKALKGAGYGVAEIVQLMQLPKATVYDRLKE